ncbi:probable lysosomal cobalamin transporter [Ornithodoros turicata]|uniref:probable lysosomal cobalamin transporter n=1 Tax=Ornithodoros turicata TaxID=34597 RepID=UPI003138A676
MLLPASVQAAGYIPFTVVLLVVLALSITYVLYLVRRRRRTARFSTWSAIVALFVALLTSVLLPVDIFIVSYMKDSHGNFTEWAASNTSRTEIEDAMLLGYYVLYSFLLLFAFVFLPFAYFFAEDEDDDEDVGWQSRACTGLKYTSAFVFLAALLFGIGAVIPLQKPPPNGTEIDKLEFIIEELKSNKGEDALGFVLAVLGLIGMAVIILYMGSGLAVFPMRLICGKSSSKNLLGGNAGNNGAAQGGAKILCLILGGGWRLVEIVVGILCLLLAVTFWISLLLANIDKIEHSLGYKTGYLLPNHTLPNPLDMLLVYAQSVYPLDYVLFVILILFLVLCTIYSIQRIGIWFLWLRVARIRAGRTYARGLLLLCLSLMYAMIAIQPLIFAVAPRYVTYGSEHFVQHIGNKTHPETVAVRCNAETSLPDDCVMTRASVLLMRFFYKAWIFGAAYYWATWVFLLITPVAAVTFAVRDCRRSHDDDEDSLEDELEDSDDHMLRA